jgi:tetratricopeptide (TPR) repeat protein
MMTPIHKILLDIQQDQSFDKLEPFKDPQAWTSMKKEEKELLAQLLVLQGEQQLAKGENKVLESFELAARISSQSSHIFYQQGKIFAAYPQNMRCLTLAHQAFSQVIERDPHHFEALHAWAKTLFRMGRIYSDITYFADANVKFELAYALLKQKPERASEEEFLSQWAVCCCYLGKSSGEPSDFYQAVLKFQRVYQLGYRTANFLNDYGNAVADLANLLDRKELFSEALQLFTEAVEADLECFDGWYNQACCFYRLSELTGQEEYLEQAEASFERAAELGPERSYLWLKWGQLETTVGKLKRDIKKVEASLEKFNKANTLEPDHPVVLSCWGETELFLGAHHERLDLIQSAKQKILKSLEIHPENPDIWYLYGSCLNELGRYFSDEDFYNQAIEKFQYGVSLNNRNPLLWYGLALAHFALGDLTEDVHMIENSVRYCAKVLECEGDLFPQFWNDWGVALMKLAEMTNQQSYIESAIEKFETALKQPLFTLNQEDLDLEWVYNYGCAFDLLGDVTEDARCFEKAVQILSQVVQLDPDYAPARYNLALALSHLGEATFDVECYHKAIEHFHQLIEQESEDEMGHMDLGVSLVNLALLIEDEHQPEKTKALYQKAEEHLMQALTLGNCQAYYQLAGLYSIMGNYHAAMHYMERSQQYGALPSIDDLLHDDWLEGLRQTPAFRQFIAQLSSQQSKED